eukprot:CAMPEP_0195528612 /NCGR_PEP_ID=MMETSP0794_2-20130614/30825_1 /TAXON_ID=515487 /ORGANISM="Stephanopyxis turris, Strain CCMP 815" /LENGTH=309 /DNA_ID=CAMNT_0040659775 /DNA_START=42 /DNA_END=971 /DNA_ORIENTATION=+
MTLADDKVVEAELEDEYYIDEEGADTNESQLEEGKEIAKGSHAVPKGVAVEELKNYGGKKKLRDECPEDVMELLVKKDLKPVYDKFVQAICDNSNVHGPLSGWKDTSFASVLDLFTNDFADKGVKVVLCKRKSGDGTRRWLEFIDVEAIGDNYVPQFDVTNWSGQVIKTCYTKLSFPNGVAVEELKQWGGRKKLKMKVPIYVEKLLEAHNLMEEYNQLVDHCIESGIGVIFKDWKIEKLKEIISVYKPMFHEKGVDIFVCHKQEWISHGQHGGHYEYFRWIEFVDRELQPNYYPQRDAETKDEKGCMVM